MRLDHLLEFQRTRILTEQITQPQPIEKSEKAYSGESFEKIFQRQLESAKNLTFSKHAKLRMVERNINLTESQLNRLNEAVQKAEAKGVKDTLVLMDQMAFIVSVNNSTVVTAMSGSDIQGNVFTQIDGAVIV